MLSEERNAVLTRVAPGTPMGELMRRYWHPIAPSAELEARPFRTKEIRLLGEDLVLFRDRSPSGRLGLVQRRCAHRRVNLAYGMVEEDGLRCCYHGWKFDHNGRCIEQPFEDTTREDHSFRDKCGIKGYPVQDLAGLIWAYLGPQPAPLLPRWAPLVWKEAVRDITLVDLPCNWLQCQENTPDPVHTEWLHTNYAEYVRQIKDFREGTNFKGFGPTAGRPHKKIRFYDIEYGFVKARLVEGDTGEEEDWTVGHPCLFPNILCSGDQFAYMMQFRVPIDDTHTSHITLYVFPAAPGTQAPLQKRVPYRYVPLRDEEGEWLLSYSFNQDYMAWCEQGAIAERHLENLGESDRGIVKFRRMLIEQLEKVRRGEEPMNVFRDPDNNICLDFPREKIKHLRYTRPLYRPTDGMGTMLGEAGFSADTDLIEQTLATWDTIPTYARSDGTPAHERLVHESSVPRPSSTVESASP